MKTTTVLLDAGGVILDEAEDEKVRVSVATEVLSSAVPGYSQAALYSDLYEAIQFFCPRILAYVFWKHVKPDTCLYDQLYDSFLKTWRPRRPPLRLMRGFKDEVSAISEDFDVGIAGQYGKDLLGLLERNDLLGCFKYRFTQDDFAITKPDPRYLEEIVEACGVEAEECIMVGDRIDNDIIPAKQLGMKTVLVRVGLHKRQQPRIPFEVPDVELAGIGGLAGAVRKLGGIS